VNATFWRRFKSMENGKNERRHTEEMQCGVRRIVRTDNRR
jgi:hypothetical protein